MLLKTWRQLRRKSQLAVAVDASISARHLSFVESGRSVPSREMVEVLSDALDVPLRERNALLVAAGYAPLYPEHPLASSELAVVRNALDQLLRHQEPYPAVVLDRQWNIVQTNDAAPKFFGMFMDVDARPKPANLLRSMFDPSGMRPWIANWPVVAETLVQRVFREAVAGVPDPQVLALLDELQSLPGVPAPRADSAAVSLPLHSVHFVKGDVDVRFFSMVTTVGAPFDVTGRSYGLRRSFRVIRRRTGLRGGGLRGEVASGPPARSPAANPAAPERHAAVVGGRPLHGVGLLTVFEVAARRLCYSRHCHALASRSLRHSVTV